MPSENWRSPTAEAGRASAPSSRDRWTASSAANAWISARSGHSPRDSSSTRRGHGISRPRIRSAITAAAGAGSPMRRARAGPCASGPLRTTIFVPRGGSAGMPYTIPTGSRPRRCGSGTRSWTAPGTKPFRSLPPTSRSSRTSAARGASAVSAPFGPRTRTTMSSRSSCAPLWGRTTWTCSHDSGYRKD